LLWGVAFLFEIGVANTMGDSRNLRRKFANRHPELADILL